MIRKYGSFLILLLLIAVIAWFWGRSSQTRIDESNIVTQVRRLRSLSTVRYTVQRVVTMEEQKDPIGSERIMLILQARVEAGLDLSEIQQRDIERSSDGTVTVRLPRARILNTAIDEKETRVWDRSKTWWTPWVPYSNDLEKKARLQGLEGARQMAIDMGILKQAEQEGADAVRTLLSLSGVKSINIITGSVT